MLLLVECVGGLLSIINLTPHTVNLLVAGQPLTIERKGRIPRVEEVIEFQEQTNEGAYIYNISYGGVIDAPPIVPNTIYVVSRMIAEQLQGRNDLCFPFMLERDPSGAVVVARSLGRVVAKHRSI